MHQLGDERVLFAFARDLEPALRVASGDTVRIRTQDCFGNQVQTPEDELDEIDWDRINPATGPVFVEGAVPGGALKVTIENIELDPQTASCTGKDEGVCGDRFDAWSTHLCAIDGDKLVWNDQLSIPLNPMIGVIGVAPAGDPVNCGTPGSHGGNMDNTAITTGATLYFPVAVEGALFGCGDSASYPDSFCDALAEIRDGLEATGCTFVGALDAAEYDGCASRICRDGKVIGLAVDDGASEAVNDARMEKWIAAVGF